VHGPAGVLTVVLYETALGGLALLWLAPLWGVVRPGFFKLAGGTALVCAALAWLAGRGGLAGAGATGRTAALWLGVFAAALLVWQVLLYARVPAARWAGMAAVLPGLVAGWPLAELSGRPALGALALATGALFLGATMDGLLLGHWYLVDRGLARDHIRRFAAILIGAVILEAVAVAVLGFGGQPPSAEGFSPLLAISGLATWLALGMVTCTALIAFLIRASLRSERSRAVQAATGFFYLAVITAFTAELAAKVGFLE
jgi:hypothetical protein